MNVDESSNSQAARVSGNNNARVQVFPLNEESAKVLTKYEHIQCMQVVNPITHTHNQKLTLKQLFNKQTNKQTNK